MSNKKSRRQFLQEIGALSSGAAFLQSPLGMITQSIIGSALTRSMAQAQSLNPRRYVNIQLPGAPPRWMFDLMLNAYGTTDVLNLNNPMVATKYAASAGRYTGFEYRTVLLHGIRVPWIWQYNVPAAGGGTRPMSDLLANLLVLQGITTSNPGHPGSRRLHFKPSGATQSLGALSADNSTAPIPAVNFNAQQFLFTSLKGKSAVPLASTGNMLQNLLTPFISQASASFKNKKDSVSLKESLREVASALDAMGQSDQLNSLSLIESQKSAEDLMNGSFGDLNLEWNTLLAKYTDLVNRSIKMTITGVNDLPIGSTTPSTRGLEYQIRGQIVQFPDLRDLTSSAGLKIDKVAQQFAVTEYVLKKSLSYSFTMSIDAMSGLKTGAGLNTIATHDHDEHTTGQFPSMLINSLYFTAMSSCMLELISSLQAANLWQETVIDFGGEFNRLPNLDGSGSEHGYLGQSVSLFSGGFNGPLVLGNVKAAQGIDAWGKGAPVTELGRQLQLNDMAATIAYLLRTTNPITSANPLVTINAGTNQIEGAIEKAKRV